MVAVVPKVNFHASSLVNEFVHISVLYADLMPPDLAAGVLGNRKYQEEHEGLRSEGVRAELVKNEIRIPEREWFDLARILMKWDGPVARGELIDGGWSAEMFRKIQLQGGAGFEQIWKEAELRLAEYRTKFESLWSPVSDRVLSKLSSLAKTDWRSSDIRVHFVDCLYGGFAWQDCIGVAPVLDMEVETKLVAHEMSELITPQGFVALNAKRARLDPGIAHTVVDLLAYFSVKDFLPKNDVPGVEKKGIKPNPNYYPMVRELFPFFEDYAENPAAYPHWSGVIEDMILAVRKPELSTGPVG